MYCFLLFPYCKSDVVMFVIYIAPHTPGSCTCPESTDQTPAVVALSAVLVAVILLLAVAILTTILLYTSESDVKVSCMCVYVCARAFKGMSLFDH